MGKEIERKYLVRSIPDHLEQYPSAELEQAYLNIKPVVRIRKSGMRYELTYKGEGMLEREEYNLPLDQKSYEHLKTKADGLVLCKRRYQIPVDRYTAELDIFEGEYEGLMLVEVEFPTVEEAEQFQAPDWFGEDVTYSGRYSNSVLSQKKHFF